MLKNISKLPNVSSARNDNLSSHDTLGAQSYLILISGVVIHTGQPDSPRASSSASIREVKSSLLAFLISSLDLRFSSMASQPRFPTLKSPHPQQGDLLEVPLSPVRVSIPLAIQEFVFPSDRLTEHSLQTKPDFHWQFSSSGTVQCRTSPQS